MSPKNKRRAFLFGGEPLFLLLVLAAAALSGLFWGCPMHNFFGLPCPGCGLSRAAASVFRLDFVGAARFHPLIFALPCLAAVILFKDFPVFKKLYDSTVFWICVPALFAGVYIIRMLFLFPRTPPLDFNKNAVLVRFFFAGNTIIK